MDLAQPTSSYPDDFPAQRDGDPAALDFRAEDALADGATLQSDGSDAAAGAGQAGSHDNPFLRVAFGRQLLDYEQERALGRRLGDARAAMTEALAAFTPCVRHLLEAWRLAVSGERSPGEVLQWPSGTPGKADGEELAPADARGGVRGRMAEMSLRFECWLGGLEGDPPLDTPLDVRRHFTEAAPAFAMLCELQSVARTALSGAPAGMRGRPELERALQRAEAAGIAFQDARRTMLECNLRLVFSIAGKFVNNGIPYDDLVQEGSIGLMRAIEKFDPALGFKFSTYASTWIWQAVTRAIANQRRTVRVPAHIHDKMIRVRGVAAKIEQRTGREPGVEELARICKLSPDVVVRALNAANRALSLDAPLRAGEEGSLLETVAVEGQDDAESAVQQDEVRAMVRRELSRLPRRDATILRLRMGLGGGEPHTLEEIGAILGITRERARQIQNRALEVLRSRLGEAGAALD